MKVNELMVVYKELEDVQVNCLNSRESFEDNKSFLQERLAEEKNETIRALLEKDNSFLDRIQIQTASAREFAVSISLQNPEENAIYQAISRVSKLLSDQGFHVKAADKDDLKRIISVYFVQNMTNVYYDDFDGERFADYEFN